MLGVHFVKKDQCIREKGPSERLPELPPIATIVEQVDRTIRKSTREARHVERDVLSVAPEIDDGPSAGLRADCTRVPLPLQREG
jgi:hypothetical protein